MTCLLSLPALMVLTTSIATAKPPNIVVILSDDMGFSDLSCYGSEIETPTLDTLAAGGLRFTQFYNTARCCPTRASLLTGLYPHQAGIGHMMDDRGLPGYRGDLNQSCRTIAEVLKPAGYQTCAVGKWHVTPHVRPGTSQHNWPLQRGFDRHYGTIHGAGSFYDPNSLTRDNVLISPFADPEYQPETYFYTDAISDHAVRFIDEHFNNPRAESTGPFFLYAAYTAAHWPMHALPEDVAKYKGKYDTGYGAIRAARLQKAKALGLVVPETELSPQAEDWDAVEHREWEIRCMEVYAAMIDRMDRGIGKIVAELEATGQLKNTLIFFLQDNGGCAEGMGRTARSPQVVRADRPSLPPMKPDELQLDMIPKQTRDGWPVLQGPGVLPGPADTFHGYGRGWANVSNTPFREYKHWVHEGGISTPLIVHWPEGISRHGELEHQPGHLIDIMATCVDVAGAHYPQQFGDSEIHPLEGRSLRPTFRGGQIDRQAIYWEHEGNRAIRVGRWKLVAKEDQPWELYDIDTDRTELHDRSAEQPDRVREMSAQWDAWAARANVLPLGSWKARPGVSGKSTQRAFDFAADANVPRADAPDIGGRPFTLQVKVSKPGTDGVLMAQGGDLHGFSLFVRQRQIHFVVTRNGERSEVTSPEARLTEPGSVAVALNRKGRVTVKFAGRVVAAGRVPGLLLAVPADGLQVGCDLAGTVGDYDKPFAYNGEIQQARLELDTAKLP
ncbi:MAG: arylsulfatase [Planctomycetaceae bacterium]